MPLNKILKSAMSRNNLKPVDVAARAGISLPTVVGYLKDGSGTRMPVVTLHRLCEATGVDFQTAIEAVLADARR